MFNKDEIRFISENENVELNKLRLKYAFKDELNYSLLINHLEGKKKAKNKLPDLYKNSKIIFPPSSNLEQSSSEITAKYKAKIFNGSNGIDLTGGFGIDSIYISKSFEKFTHIEPNLDLLKISKSNFKILNLNIECINSTCEEFLDANKDNFDFIFIDPSRKRDGKKTVFLEDYLPNVVSIQDKLKAIGKQVLIKTSPLLDIKDTIKKLKNISEIHIISVKNDLKEVLYLIEDNRNKVIKFKTFNFNKEKTNESFEFNSSCLEDSKVIYGNPETYIYEPNSSVMKSGAFFYVSEHFKINKLHKNSHLYTSNELINNFPGRVFKLNQVLSFNKKELKSITKANVTTRNFPFSVAEIRKKTKIKDGGDVYLFATTLINEKPVILNCSKIENQ